MMHHDRSLAPTRRSAYPTTVAVALPDSLTETAEVFLILPLECVTRRTEAMGEDLLIPAVRAARDKPAGFAPRRRGESVPGGELPRE